MEHSYRLLAVDDEPDILRTNRRYLEARGYQVDTGMNWWIPRWSGFIPEQPRPVRIWGLGTA